MTATLPTIKQRIVAEMRTALRSLSVLGQASGVGLVIDVDAAALIQAGRSESWTQAVQAAIAQGKFAVELDIGPSENAMPQDPPSAARMVGVDQYEFDAILVAHLPDPLPGVKDSPTGELLTPIEAAEQFCAEVHALCSPLSGSSGTQCGRWYDTTGGAQNGQPLAVFTAVEQMGGVGLSEIGTRITACVLRVRYRTSSANAGVLA